MKRNYMRTVQIFERDNIQTSKIILEKKLSGLLKSLVNSQPKVGWMNTCILQMFKYLNVLLRNVTTFLSFLMV